MYVYSFYNVFYSYSIMYWCQFYMCFLLLIEEKIQLGCFLQKKFDCFLKCYIWCCRFYMWYFYYFFCVFVNIFDKEYGSMEEYKVQRLFVDKFGIVCFLNCLFYDEKLIIVLIKNVKCWLYW